jgi:hypothetical protein
MALDLLLKAVRVEKAHKIGISGIKKFDHAG